MRRWLFITALGASLLATPVWAQRGGRGGMSMGGGRGGFSSGGGSFAPHGGGYGHGTSYGGAPHAGAYWEAGSRGWSGGAWNGSGWHGSYPYRPWGYRPWGYGYGGWGWPGGAGTAASAGTIPPTLTIRIPTRMRRRRIRPMCTFLPITRVITRRTARPNSRTSIA